MLRTFPWMLCFALSFLLNQSARATNQPSTGRQVVYLQDGTTLLTYNVNQQTLSATQVGTPFTLPMATFSLLTPSVNGEFLYIQGTDSSQNQRLWVFATDASGVPQTTPVQVLNASAMYSFEIDPSANFAYAIVGSLNSQNQTVYGIRSYAVDTLTGKLSSPTLVAKYPPNGPCGAVDGASPGLNGFSPNGHAFYDNWFCNYHGNVNATYYERAVNLQTGALGSETEVYNWNNGSEGYDNVTFINNRIVDFSTPNPYLLGENSLSIYPVVPNSTTPLLQCTADMLEACGYSIGDTVHPSGKYIFFILNYYTDQIAQIEPASMQLVDTGNYIPYQVSKFSPDGTIVYALSVGSTTYDVEIYGFDPATADVTTTGGLIGAPAISDTFWPVLRQ